MIERCLILLFFALLAGCGYQVPQAGDDWVGGDARLLHVELFQNRTGEPYLENYLAEKVVEQFSRSRLVSITERSEFADVVLRGTVESFSTNAIAYNAADRISEYRADITVSAQLIRLRDRQVLWQQRLNRSDEFLAPVNKNLQLEGQELAAREVSARLAEDLYAHMFNTF